MSEPNPDTKAVTDSGDTDPLRVSGWDAINDYVADGVADPDEKPDDYYVTPRKRETTPLAAPDDDVDAALFQSRYVELSGIDVTDQLCDDKIKEVTIADARKQQRRVIRKDINKGVNAGLGRVDHQYARIVRGDVFLRERQESTTTVLITLRQSPIDSDDEPIPPVSLRDRLSVSWQKVRPSVRSKLNYRDLPYEYALVASGTKRWATPHLHILYYIEDPNDAVARELFEDAVTKHIEEHTNVTAEMHQLRDGNGGAIRVQSAPELATGSSRWDESEGQYVTPCKASVYLATQLPRMLIADEIEGNENVRDTAWDTLVWSRASSKKSFTTSQGWPTLE